MLASVFEDLHAARLDSLARYSTAVMRGVKASVSAIDAPHPAWAVPVDVYFRRVGGAWQLVGVERLPNTAPAAPAKK